MCLMFRQGPNQGCQGQRSTSGKLNSFQDREKSESFVVGQGNKETMAKDQIEVKGTLNLTHPLPTPSHTLMGTTHKGKIATLGRKFFSLSTPQFPS